MIVGEDPMDLAAASLHRQTSPTVEPAKEEVTIEMDDCSDLDRKVPVNKKLPSRSAKKRVAYSDKSDSELECDEDSDEAPKKRSFKKKANAIDNDEFELGPDAAPALTHLLGTSESARSYTLRTLAPVTNLSPWKKKSWPSQRQSCGKENWGSDVNMVSLQIPPSKMAMKPRAVSLSPEDNRKTCEQHYPWAHSSIKSHADLFFKITGVKAYLTTCPQEKMLEGLVEDGYTKVFGGHYPPPHKEGNPYGYVGKDSRALDHTTFLTEHAFIRSLPIEFQEFCNAPSHVLSCFS